VRSLLRGARAGLVPPIQERRGGSPPEAESPLARTRTQRLAVELLRYSRFMRAMFSVEIPFGQAAMHS